MDALSLFSGAGGWASICRCGAAKCVSHEQKDSDGADTRVVLPPTVEPVSYALDLVVRLDDHAFDGTVAIEVAVRAAGVTTVALHAKDLEFKGAASFAPSGEGACDIESTSTVVDKETMTVTFTFGSSLPEGRGILSIDYVGELNNQMAGFYRSEYVNVKGEKKLMASTQFESIDARRCLPCWDEPRRKATFTCSLRVPTHMTALSNMPESMVRGRAIRRAIRRNSSETPPPLQVRDHGDGTKTVSFMPSPRMSTYLLAFVVGEFDFVSALTKNGVTIRVFCPPGKPQLGRFALECAVNALDAYDDTFQIRCPLCPRNTTAECGAILPTAAHPFTSSSGTRCRSRTWWRSRNLRWARWRTGAS